MKRLSLYLFLILFTLQAPSLADDIRDFQIEGVSLYDSLLTHFTEQEIKNNKRDVRWTDNIFSKIEFHRLSSFKTYDIVQFFYKTNDDQFKIYGIYGIIDINDFNKCIKQMNIIKTELRELFENQDILREDNIVKEKLYYDKSGKSIYSQYTIDFKSGHGGQVACEDISEELIKEIPGYRDLLRVGIESKEFIKYLYSQN